MLSVLAHQQAESLKSQFTLPLERAECWQELESLCLPTHKETEDSLQQKAWQVKVVKIALYPADLDSIASFDSNLRMAVSSQTISFCGLALLIDVQILF